MTLPLTLPGVLSGVMLAFAMSLDDFVISFFVTGATTHHAAAEGLFVGQDGRFAAGQRPVHADAGARWPMAMAVKQLALDRPRKDMPAAANQGLSI